MNLSKLSALVALAAGLCLSSSAMAEKTVIDHGNGEKTTVKSNKEGSTTERGGTKETTRESHKEAVGRVTKESKDRGEKATKQK